VRVAGADVWKGRWVVVTLDDGRFDAAAVAPTFSDAVAVARDAVVVGADIPLTVPGPGERRPEELAARAFIGPRGRSLFITPPRDVLAATSHEAANRLARAQGLGGVSAQSYALGRLVLDALPVGAADDRVHEVHPEGSFVVAGGGRHLQWAKTTWNGVALRRRILEAQGISIPEDLGAAGVAGVADVLDATVVAWTAHRIATGAAERFPAGHGRLGAIWR
jgi:predicted RNase H-like nuclease